MLKRVTENPQSRTVANVCNVDMAGQNGDAIATARYPQNDDEHLM